MTPVTYKGFNVKFGPPADLEESQCRTIDAYQGKILGTSVDGVPVVVTAWRPDARELAALNAGAPIFVTFLSGGLPPHMLTTSFSEALAPA